jgi:hypothetical protein
MRLRHPFLFTFIAGAALTATAGTVNVSFVNPTAYSDAGTYRDQENDNLQSLARYLQALGQQYLPPNQALKVEVLDVDLAGTVRPTRRGDEVRIVRGKADFPRMHLQYTLEADGKPVRSGNEWLNDLTYTGGLTTYRKSEPLYYEKHMLEAWFKARFVEQRAAAK